MKPERCNGKLMAASSAPKERRSGRGWKNDLEMSLVYQIRRTATSRKARSTFDVRGHAVRLFPHRKNFNFE
eukprot:626939-Heterocapsa_arctica.AAC.1